MASSEPAAIELLTQADLPNCLALSTQAHWNQTAADWRIFFDQGSVWGIRRSGSVVASAAILPYPPDTAWVSMVLTAKSERGRGHAGRLAAAAMNDSARRGMAPQLDATPEGEPIYSQLGFRTVARLTRWRRTPPAARDQHRQASGQSTDLTQTDFDAACRLDASSLGFARPNLLRCLAERGPAAVKPTAFALSREGRTARHIGPIAAENVKDAEIVAEALLQRAGSDRPVIVDSFDSANGLAGFLQAHGFAPERQFMRMVKGAAPRIETGRYFAAAGPEFG
jgi:hypothetical protein